MRIIPSESINRHATENLVGFINASEEEYHYQLEQTANGIIKNVNEKPIILICGPSGSGKTVSAHRIRHILEERGFRTHILSMDNYFLPLDDVRNAHDKNGKIDLESPKRLDIDFLNTQFEMIRRCEEVVLPVFDFTTQTRLEGNRFKRSEKDLVILEGIHALNPSVTGSFAPHASKVYVSVRTRIQTDENSFMHPSKIRLMRRLVRDKLFRGRHAADTIKNFESVQRGEKLYIMPYKVSAEYDVDTFMPFEPCVYKNFLMDELKNAVVNAEERTVKKINELLRFMEQILLIAPDAVFPNSLVREFIGGNELME